MRIAANKSSDGQLLTSWGARSHFNITEFLCKCGKCEFKEVDQILIDLLETVRLQLAKPISVVSGIRCPKHNAKVEGAVRSQHLPDANGISGAADLYSKGVSSGRFFMLALEAGAPGRGMGSTKVHMDSRETPASWMYGDYSGLKPELWIAEAIEAYFNK